MSAPHPYGARPKKSRTPPPGYRLLVVGEVVQEGDMVCVDNRWTTVTSYEFGHIISRESWPRARKIEAGGAS